MGQPAMGQPATEQPATEQPAVFARSTGSSRSRFFASLGAGGAWTAGTVVTVGAPDGEIGEEEGDTGAVSGTAGGSAGFFRRRNPNMATLRLAILPVDTTMSSIAHLLVLATGLCLFPTVQAAAPSAAPAANDSAVSGPKLVEAAAAPPPVVKAPPDAAAPPVAGLLATDSPTTERTLPNGMKVVVREDRRAPTVVQLVLYKVGSIDEFNGTTGVSHALEHMMFKGTKTLAVGEFSRRVAERGGRENAFTTRDYTGYFQQIERSHLGEMMKLEADRMANLVVDDKEFSREIRVVMEERRWRTDDRAPARVNEQLMASTFIASPYRRPVIGWASDLQAMTAANVRDWYHTWYTPSNAVLVVAGDVSADEVWKLATDTYGKVAAHDLPVRKPQEEPVQRGIRRVAVKAPAENPYVMMGFHVPGLVDVEKDSEPYALEMLAAVLDADENGRLTRRLVRGSRLANQVGAGYDMTGRGPALFVLDGTPAEGHDTAELESALRAEITRIADEGVRDDELQRIKTQYLAGRIYRRDSVMAQAMEIGALEVGGYSYRDADRILERIRSVGTADVQAVARKYFGDDELTVATLLPQPVDKSAPPAAPPPGLLR